jgi:hypothetical protein
MFTVMHACSACHVLASTHSRSVLLYTGWDHYKFTNKLLKGEYQAVISDASQLVSISNKDQSCNLHILPDRILPFDIAVAFAKGFNDSELISNVDAAIVELQEAGMLLVRCWSTLLALQLRCVLSCHWSCMHAVLADTCTSTGHATSNACVLSCH